VSFGDVTALMLADLGRLGFTNQADWEYGIREFKKVAAFRQLQQRLSPPAAAASVARASAKQAAKRWPAGWHRAFAPLSAAAASAGV